MRTAVRLAFITGLAFWACMMNAAVAEVRLPALVGDNMVLQRDAKVQVWGRAEPGEAVRVTLLEATHTAAADSEGIWSMSLGPYTAGGPHKVRIQGSNNEITLHDVLIGDVWLASGQSNMSFTVKSGPYGGMGGVLNERDELARAVVPQLRLFTVRQEVVGAPQTNLASEGWVAATPQSVGQFSAVAYFFGRTLHERYRIPIGLIDADYGGTLAEAWVSEAGLSDFPEFRGEIASLKQGALSCTSMWSRVPPTALFNGMIQPLTRYRIKGVIWYQGEANAGERRGVQYRTLFPALINDWRAHWGYQFPFLFVQLAGFVPDSSGPDDLSWAELREAQSMALSVPDTGMATAIDLGDEMEVHPRKKQDVGYRLARVASKVAYGEKIECCGPTYKSMQVEGKRIRIKFKDAGSGLVNKDRYGYVRGFQIAGADRKFVWAQAQLDGPEVVVWSDQISRPVAVRYSWANMPDGSIYSGEGLPALPFRTDSSTNTPLQMSSR